MAEGWFDPDISANSWFDVQITADGWFDPAQITDTGGAGPAPGPRRRPIIVG